MEVVESCMELSLKTKNGTALWPGNSTSGNLPKETWETKSKEHKHPYVLCSVIYNLPDMQAAQVSLNRWVDIKQLSGIYTMEYSSAVNMKKI